MRLGAMLATLVGLIVVLALVSLIVGPAHIGLPQLLDGLSEKEARIILGLRLPRIILALLAGAGLAVSGALMQTFFRNPLAEPYITGVSAGGALGAVLISALGLGGVLLTGLSAVLGGVLITVALFMFAQRFRGGTTAVLLLGLALGTFCGAVVWFLLLKLGPGGTDQAISWLLGRVSTVGYTEIYFLAPATVLGLLAAFYYAPDLDALLLGEDKAASLGVNLVPGREPGGRPARHPRHGVALGSGLRGLLRRYRLCWPDGAARAAHLPRRDPHAAAASLRPGWRRTGAGG